MNDAPSDDASSSSFAPSPAERLRASRARLRGALAKAQGRSSTRPRDAADGEPSSFSFIDTIERVLRDTWTLHPLRRAWDVFRQIVGPVAAQQLRPIVSSHPLRVVALAAGVGGLLIWLRPWRLLPQAALLSMLVPQRAIWQALMASGLDKLADGEWIAQWFRDATSTDAKTQAETDAPVSEGLSATASPTPAPTPPKDEVLHRVQPDADGARAA